MSLPFWKVQSIGNHFVLVRLADVEDRDLADLAIRVCRHHFGVGADGLLVLGPLAEGLFLRMFNPDGSEDFCGNGLRCAAVFGRSQDMIDRDEFSIEHLGKQVEAVIAGDLVKTTLEPATYDPAAVPHLIGHEVAGEDIFGTGHRTHALSTGSTHCVIFVEELPADPAFAKASRAIELDERFPERTSVIWTQIRDSGLNLRVWERGVGETLGCGTGSTAAAVAFRREHPDSRSDVAVNSKGGSLRIALDDWASSPTISGTAETLFSGELD